ncbi:MAG TPA: transposase [Candidatus Sulfotelmatobacter sp.]|jgi:putative transposase|nr:transposase [Candidatus Sulfotelmatobacter sp.]
MSRLTHRTSAGWTYFVTTKAFQSANAFQVHEVATIVVGKLLEYRDKGNYLLHEFVVMPNHLHVLITPSDAATLERCMQLIKGASSYEIHRVRGGRMPVWQSSFHDAKVKDWKDYRIKVDYIRFNPITAKLVARPEEWPFSSVGGQFAVDPIPQGLKPIVAAINVGPKGPTPKTADQLPGLKPRPPKEKEFRGRGGV